MGSKAADLQRVAALYGSTGAQRRALRRRQAQWTRQYRRDPDVVRWLREAARAVRALQQGEAA